MVQTCVFNEVTDIVECRPGLACDIAVAKETGSIVDVGMTDEYNGLADPSQIGELIRDRFTQIDKLRALARQNGIAENASGNFVPPVQTSADTE